MVTLEKTKELIKRAHDCACVHGFHDVEHSVSHWMMLVVSEVGEMVEAERKGRLRCDLGIFDDALRTRSFDDAFREYVKDSVADEMADVCIRLYDFCGLRGIEPLVLDDDDDSMLVMRETFQKELGDLSLCERCFSLCALLCEGEGERNNISDKELSSIIGASLCLVWIMADDMGIDLLRHIELKMMYNEGREKRHGKKY